MSIKLAGLLTTELAEVGIAIPKFVIENISLPPEVEKALDKRSSMGILGNLNQYTQFQAANALEQAAANPGGASEGMSLGLGLAAGQQMAATLAGNAAQPTPVAPAAAPTPAAAAAAPPPLPAAAEWFIGVNGQQQGPFDAAALAAQVSGGALTARDAGLEDGHGRLGAGRPGPGDRGAARRGPAAAAPAVTAFPAPFFRSVQIRSVQRSPG